MGKPKRGKRKRSTGMAQRRNTPKLGKEQLPASGSTGGVPSTVENEEAPSADGELNSIERPNRGGRVRDILHSNTEEGVDRLVPDVQTGQGDGPAEDRLNDWPYCIVRTPGDLEALGTWLQEMGREVEKTPVGIAVNSAELAFATKVQGWLIPNYGWDSLTLHPLLRGVLTRALTSERTAPALVTRSTGDLIADLEPWLGENYDRTALLSTVVHDMEALEYATGRPIVRGLPALKDALDCSVVGPGMALEAPSFYSQVGLPLVKLNASGQNLALGREGNRWTLVYDWLLFRVLAYLTRDPTINGWLRDGKSPLGEFASYLELDSKQATAFLLWMVCGEDETLVSRYYPDWATRIPEAPQLIKASRVDKTLPSLRLGLLGLMDEYTTSRRATTLYGRQSPWGLRPQELLHFNIMGSVNDLLDVVIASIAKMGSTTHWLLSEGENHYNRWFRATIIGYTDESSQEWQQQLEELGLLNHPLGMISLDPRVTVE